jgi:TRAP transporter 4TM/12TM fusion protein
MIGITEHMRPPPNQPAQETEEILHRESGPRTVGGPVGMLIAGLAAGWSLFQLALPQWLLISSDVVRSIHLACALALVYLCYPARRRGPRNHVPGFDMLLAVLGATASLYMAYDVDGIASRLGRPSPLDLAAGGAVILLLLEAARRALGPALPLIAGLFILYSLFSESMPDLIAFKNASPEKIIGKLALTTEGIYGVPLDVSASIVFLFVLFGAMLERAGAGQYFIDLAFALLGKYRGGPAKAAVLASGLTGMVNGSSIANTVTTGTFTIPLMKRSGYPAVKAGAIEVAASTNGQLMPPIMGAAAFIIAEYCNLDYLEVVRAAALPALISYVALLFIVHIEATRLGLRRLTAAELPRFGAVFVRGAHFLLPIFLLIYQLVVLRHSATLAAFYAILCLATLMAARHALRALRGETGPAAAVRDTLQEFGQSLVRGARNMMGIGVAVAAAGIIVGVVTLGLGNVITELIGWLSGGRLLPMLCITAVVSLILGMGLPTTANYIVMASLTAPAILLLAGDAGFAVPMIAAHLFVFYFGILSDDTPPVGLSAYAAAAISGADPIRTGLQGFRYDMRTALLPFMFFFNTDLLLIGITHPAHILFLFVTGMIGLCAFAAITQGFWLVRLRWLEFIALTVSIITILCPWLLERFIPAPRLIGPGLGVLVFALVYLSQSRAADTRLQSRQQSS